jgi:putative nucleotidyltransferase with HDIG domain
LQKASSSGKPVAAAEETAAEFIRIPLEGLRLDTVTGFKIYLRTEGEREPVLYRAENLPFTEQVKKRLIESKVEHVYIDADDRDKYQKYIEDNLDKIVADDHIEPVKKAEIVYSSASYLMERLFENPTLGKNIRRGEKLVVNTVDFILRDDRAFRSLLAVTSYDYYTYTHSVNVCVYSIALAQRLGLGNKLDIKTLGTGALLHDIGKSIIDKGIINKKGPLNDEEWQAIKKHPVYGVELLRKTGKVPEESYVVVNQHHERSDRTGYPEGRPMDKIHPYARVSAIADVFDALTTKRAYKGAVGTFAALNIMRDEMRTAFDRDMFREFVQMMGK